MNTLDSSDTFPSDDLQPGMVSAAEFVLLLQQHHSPHAAAAIISDVEPNLRGKRDLVRLIPNEAFRNNVANCLFGELAGRIGARSSAGHPTTDYGCPRFVDDPCYDR